jgi:hypothetical protein
MMARKALRPTRLGSYGWGAVIHEGAGDVRGVSPGWRPPSRMRRARVRRRSRRCRCACRGRRCRGVSSVRAGVAARARRSARPWGLGRPGGLRGPRRPRAGDGSGGLPRRAVCARGGGPALVIWPWTRFSLGVYSDGTIPRNPDSRPGFANRAKLPTSAHKPAAESVSMPRRQRSRATVGAWLLAGAASSSTPISARRRCTSPSTAAQESMNVTRERASSKARLRSQRPCGCVHARPVSATRDAAGTSRAGEASARASSNATHQIPETLILQARHERERELPRREQPHKPLRVTPVSLDPIPRRARDRPRRDDTHIKPRRARRPGEPEPRRPPPHRPRALAAPTPPRTLAPPPPARHATCSTRHSPVTGSSTAATYSA